MSDANRRPGEHTDCRASGGFLRKIARSQAGNVLPLVAIGTLVLAGLVGSGVDMARAYMAQRRLQAACDAGVLAGRRAVSTNGWDTVAQGQAKTYFDANFSDDKQGTSGTNFTPSSSDSGNTVTGTASSQLPTIIMGIFGFDNMDLGVTCSASMGVGNSDIVFVLDNTGSMEWDAGGDGHKSRIEALQDAMKKFYTTVSASVGGSNARVRYGFVPYSSAVNVGEILEGVDDSLAPSTTIQTRVANFYDYDYIVDSISVPQDFSNPTEDSFYNCESHNIREEYGSKPDPIIIKEYDKKWSWNNWKCYQVGEQYTVTYIDQKAYHFSGWTQKKATLSTLSYGAFQSTPIAVHLDRNLSYIDAEEAKQYDIVTLGANTEIRGMTTEDTLWDGCILERSTTPASSFSFVSLEQGIVASNGQPALDLDIDLSPSASNIASQWSPLWPEATYDGDDDHDHPGTYCPYKSELLGIRTQTEFNTYVDSLAPVGSTYHDIGLLWGARVSSPTGIFADTVNKAPANGGTVSRHLIFMTDGELEPRTDINSSYGIEEMDEKVTGTGDDDDQWSNHRSRYLAICEAIKARGIRLWVIAFGTDLSDDLEACGSPDSSFEADDAEELDKYFQEIAKQVGELRVVQ